MAAINRLYSSTKFNSRSVAVSLGIKCVFISYQQKDKAEAKKVAEYLQNADIEVYFDEYDSELRIHHQSNNAKEVTNSICKGINNSSHMLVIISPNTMYSTWVPFEIGFGYDKTDLGVLCLKGIPKGGLPEYVRSAPVVRDIYDLNILISKISGKTEQLLLETRKMSSFNNYLNPLSNIMDTIVT
jgi:hypothetical protein